MQLQLWRPTSFLSNRSRRRPCQITQGQQGQISWVWTKKPFFLCDPGNDCPFFIKRQIIVLHYFLAMFFPSMILIEIFQLCPFTGILKLISKSCLKLIKNSHKTPSGGNFDGLVGSNMWEVFKCFIWILKPTITKSFSPIRSSESEPLQKAQEEFSFLHNLNYLEGEKKTN